MLSCTSTVACTSWAMLSRPLAWPSRSGRRTQAKVISVDYRLAPGTRIQAPSTAPWPPTKLSCGTAPRRQASSSPESSAGGGLAIATLVNACDHGLPLPAAAFVMSPYADLTLAGTTMETKRKADPLLSRDSSNPGSPTTPRDKTPPLASSAPYSPTYPACRP
jgi:monoterpene epsilon-lactone hydrolase